MDGIIVENNLTMMDLTILHGRYKMASYLYEIVSDKKLKTAKDYGEFSQKYFLRYVNYPVFIGGILSGKSDK